VLRINAPFASHEIGLAGRGAEKREKLLEVDKEPD